MKRSTLTIYALFGIGLITTAFTNTMNKRDVENYEYMKQRLETARDFTIEVLEAMPADQYSYKPNDDVRTFAAQGFHIAYSIEWFHASLRGTPVPWNPGDEDRMERDALIAYAKKQFDEITETIVKQEQSERFTNGIIGFLDHNSHHRGQMVGYLRMKGIEPPSYR